MEQKQKEITKIKKKLYTLKDEYNQCLDNYQEDGEEDFNIWLDLFKEKE